MSKDAPSNIKQVLNSFDSFVKIIEDPNWVRMANAEDIKTAFKLGLSIEKVINHFSSNSSLSEFMYSLQKWWNVNGRTKVYGEEFLRSACDKLLERFLQTESIPDNALDIAFRVYTSIFPKERMEKLLIDVISKKHSYDAIASFVNAISCESDLEIQEYKLKLQNWTFLMETCRGNSVETEINDLLSPYKVETSLHLLIGVLALSEVKKQENKVQETLLNCLLEKMIDRSVLSKLFWLTLFKKINTNLLLKACMNFEKFLDSFMGFIVYCGSMLRCDNGLWVSDSTVCFCPEIGYYDIVRHLKNIVKLNNTMRTSVIGKLRKAQNDTESEVWVKILKNLYNNEK